MLLQSMLLWSNLLMSNLLGAFHKSSSRFFGNKSNSIHSDNVIYLFDITFIPVNT